MNDEKAILAKSIMRSPHHPAAAFGDELVLLNVENAKYYSLDDIGADIWQRLESPVAVSDLIAALATDYGTDKAVVEKDVLALFRKAIEAEIFVLVE